MSAPLSLPSDISSAELQRLVPADLWQRDPQQAAVLALRRSGVFDEAAYLELNPDVRESGMDPILHYLQFGGREGRKVAWISPELLKREEYSRANACLAAKDYRGALSLYERLADELGQDAVAARIALCREGIERSQLSLSVIIPARDAEATIGRALDSALAQTIKDVEIIVFDDASSDGTAAVVKKYAKDFPNVALLRSEERVGPGRGRNAALERASGAWVTFLDADDYFTDDDYFAFLLETARQHDADCVVTPYMRKGEATTRDALEQGDFDGREAAGKFLQRKFGTHGACGKLFRASLLENVRFGEYGYSEDTLFVCRACLAAARVCAVDRPGYVYDCSSEASSWRPRETTAEHFYSSLRLLLEILRENMLAERPLENLRPFLEIWNREHEPRMRAWLEARGDDPATLAMRAFLGTSAILLADCARDDMVRKFLLQPLPLLKEGTGFPVDWLQRLQRLNDDVQKAVAGYAQRRAGKGKDRIVILASRLAVGGLEKVAAQLGRALAEKFEIVYLLAEPGMVVYRRHGVVLGGSLTDREALAALHGAAFILDFLYKDPAQEFPLCAYCLDRFPEKYVATIHNTDSCHYYFEKIRTYLDGRGLDAIHAVVCVSRAVRECFVQRYGSAGNIYVIENPLDWDAITQAVPVNEKEPFILFAGRLYATRHKGIDLLLNAYLKSKISARCRLLLAGSGSLDKDLQQLVQKHKNKIQCIGFKEDIYAYMKKAECVVIPSRWEGFSMTLAESLACGTPALMSEVGVGPEVVRHKENGYLVPPDSEEDIVAGLDYLNAHAAEMRDNCQESVGHLSLRRFGEQFARMLRPAPSRAPARRRAAGHFSYTIVSACYNVARYLDDFFQSLVSQTLPFREHIHCVMVDDGSTDDTALVIREWQKKYPDNIVYLHKENGGQASARNLGLRHVKTPWVTFTDPDDFLDADYFRVVDDFLGATDRPVCLVATPLVFYFEETGEYRDTHPLSFKYNEKETVIKIENIEKDIQLSAPSAIIQTERIFRHELVFDERIKPSFEDANFIGRYLLKNDACYIANLRDAKYFYRKRNSGSSTLDHAWKNKMLFKEVLLYGCLPLLRENAARNFSFAKYSVLYHLIWLVKALVNNPEKVNFLSEEEKKEFLHLFDECMSYIDMQIISQFNLAGAWFYHKVGLTHCFKKQPLPWTQIVYIEQYDEFKDEIRLRYFTGSPALEEFLIDGVDITPTHARTQRDDFLDRTFVLQRHIWLPLNEKKGVLRVRINGHDASITFARRQQREINLADIRSAHAVARHARGKALTAPWIFIDRETQADDNAEHLYRWVMRNHPYKNIYFALRRDSHDWARLEREGFRLLAYGSPEYEETLLACSKIISSQVDKFVVNYFGGTATDDKQIVWLQHGVTKDDLSRWLNPKKRIDIFVTTSPYEYDSIVRDFSRYRYTDKEVRLTGFPRHDALLSAHPPRKQILVMPTWRQSIMGTQISGNIRKKNPDFMQTLYARSWKEFLCSPELRALAEAHGYSVVFFPHPNIQLYLDDFSLPPHVQVIHAAEGSMQKIFKDAALMVTDYSSVAFEMAFLHKPVLYYQFDEKEFFSGVHTYQKGYFDYRENGFGPVATALPELLTDLARILEQEAKPDSVYLARMEQTFPLRDGRNCERVYQAMLDLETPEADGHVNAALLRDAARAAFAHDAWRLAGQRLARLRPLDDAPAVRVMSEICEIHQLLQQGMLGRATARLDALPEVAEPELQRGALRAKLLLAFLREEYDKVFAALEEPGSADDGDAWAALCAYRSGRTLEFSGDEASPQGAFLRAFLNKDWQAVEELRDALPTVIIEGSLPLCLLLCEAARAGRDWKFEEKMRKMVKSAFEQEHLWHHLSALRVLEERLDNAALKIDAVWRHLGAAFPDGAGDMPARVLALYCRALTEDRQWERIQEELPLLPAELAALPEVVETRLACAENSARWDEAAALRRELLEQGLSDDWLAYARCLKDAGQFEEAYALLKEHEEHSLEYWQLRHLLARFGENAEDIHCCVRKMARFDGEHLEVYLNS